MTLLSLRSPTPHSLMLGPCVLYEDNHLLVVDKPAGIATMGTTEAPSIHSLACDYLRERYQKPGNVFVGIVSRLDTVTSGVLVLARTSKSASRLAPQFAKHSGDGALKVYLALVDGDVANDAGTLTDWVAKDDAAHRMRVVDRSAPDAQLARLRYAVLGRRDDVSLVAVCLETGRKHQIRLQFAELGHAILGDRKYGSTRTFELKRMDRQGSEFGPAIALHSWRLRISHPTRQERMEFTATIPAAWGRYLPRVAEHDSMWEIASQRLSLSRDE